jgi:DNA-binding MarR family transcriptional regulator
MPRTKRAAHPTDARTIKDLLSYRVHKLANALSRGAALRYRQDFDVSLMEWRTIALLGDFAPLALKDIARQSGLDKGLASRVVSGLVARGLIHRAPGQEDARELALSLTADGQAVFRGLMSGATERDDALRAVLTEDELDLLDSILAKLLQAALRQAQPSVEAALD